MPAVLFICSANQCRSPMAQALFKELLRKRGFDAEGWRVESAGIWAYDGSEATTLARAIMRERGLDIDSHKSRSVNEVMLRSFDLILVMESRHLSELERLYPEIAGRVRMMSTLADLHSDIDDPVFGTIETYRDTVDHMQDLMSNGFDRIQTWVEDKR